MIVLRSGGSRRACLGCMRRGAKVGVPVVFRSVVTRRRHVRLLAWALLIRSLIAGSVLSAIQQAHVQHVIHYSLHDTEGSISLLCITCRVLRRKEQERRSSDYM